MKYLCLALLMGCVTTDPEAGTGPGESEAVAAVTTCPTGTWCVETPPPSAASTLLHGVWAASATDVFAVGDSGTILRRVNGSWTAMTSNTTANLRGVWGTSSSDVWAGGVSGALVHFNGTSWSAVSGASSDIDSVWAAAPGDAWFAGQGTVLHYTGGRFVSSGFGGILLSISGTSSSDVYATGESTNVHHWNGSSWTTLTPGVGTSTLMAVLAVGVNDAWIADFMPGKETAHWNGSKWTLFKTGGGIWDGMAAFSTSDIWGAGGTHTGHWNGTAWTLETPFGSSASLWSVTTVAANAWVVGDAGLIAHRNF